MKCCKIVFNGGMHPYLAWCTNGLLSHFYAITAYFYAISLIATFIRIFEVYVQGLPFGAIR
jgi:hypothetical protein